MRFTPLLLIALVFTACQRPPRTLDLQGHRGARGLYPENSLEGFAAALAIPEVSTLELDVVVSADRKLIISHEPWMNGAICGVDSSLVAEDESRYNLFQMSADSIGLYDCGSLGNPRFPGQKKQRTKKPLFSELIDMLGENKNWIQLNIETKSAPEGDGIFHPHPKEFVDILVKEIQGADAAYPNYDLWNKVTIQSFDPRTLREMRKLHLGAKLSLLTEEDRDPAELMDELGFPADVFSPREDLVTSEMISWCHFRGIPVIPWTVNDTTRMQELVDLGVDGLISDYPDRFESLIY